MEGASTYELWYTFQSGKSPKKVAREDLSCLYIYIYMYIYIVWMYVMYGVLIQHIMLWKNKMIIIILLSKDTSLTFPY